MNLEQINPIAVIGAISAILGIGIWVGSVNSDRKSFKNFMEEVRRDIKEILERLPPKTVTGSSPLSLTELGKTISEHIDAQRIANELAGVLSEDLQDKSYYDIQERCTDFITNEFKPSPAQDKIIRESAYEHGVKIEQVKDVIAIELRDAVIEIVAGLR